MNEELYEGIVKALERRKRERGAMEDRVQACPDFREQVEYCQKNHIPLRPTAEGPH